MTTSKASQAHEMCGGRRSERGSEQVGKSLPAAWGTDGSRARRSHEAITREARRLRSALTQLGSA